MVGRRRGRGPTSGARGSSFVLDLGAAADVAADGTLGESFDDLFADGARGAGEGAVADREGAATRRAALDDLPARTGPDPVRRPWYRSRLAWATAAVTVAVSGSLVFTSLVEETRLDDVTQLAGGIHPLRVPPSERWSVPRPGRAGIVVTPNAVVVVGDRLVAYTVSDGSLLWRSEPVGTGAACLPGVGQETADVVVCLTPLEGDDEDGVDQDVRVTTFDPSTGKRTGERTTQVFGKEAAVVGGQDLVRVHADGEEAVVVREDARTGEIRWERRLARDPSPSRALPSASIGGLSLASARGVLSVLGPGIAATYTLDGDVLEVGDVWSMVQLPDGRYVGNRYGRGVATVFDADGEPLFQIQGRVLEAPLSDGSAPGVIVANTFSGVAGVDAATGAPLWEIDSAGHQAVLRLGGQIVVRSETSLRAVDVRTGEQTWIVRVPDAAMWRPLTDGESVYVTSGVRGGDPELVSVSLQQGYVEWRTPLPDGTFQLFAVDGRIVVLREDEVVALS